MNRSQIFTKCIKLLNKVLVFCHLTLSRIMALQHSFLIFIFHSVAFAVAWIHVKGGERWMGTREKQGLLLFYFSFLPFQKKEILKVREVLFFVSWKQFFSGKVFVIKLIPSELSIRQFLIPFRNSALCVYIYVLFLYCQKCGIMLKRGYNNQNSILHFSIYP